MNTPLVPTLWRLGLLVSIPVGLRYVWLRWVDPPDHICRRRYECAKAAISNSFTLKSSEADQSYLYIRYKIIEKLIHWSDFWRLPILGLSYFALSFYSPAQLMQQYTLKVQQLGVVIDENGVSNLNKPHGLSKRPSKMQAPAMLQDDIKKNDEQEEDNDAEVSKIVDTVQNGSVHDICILIQNDSTFIQRQLNGLNLIHYAADMGRWNVVEILLNHGANINQQDVNGLTALHYACFNEHLELAEKLLINGANVSLRCNEGLTPIEQTSHLGIVDLLTKVNV